MGCIDVTYIETDCYTGKRGMDFHGEILVANGNILFSPNSGESFVRNTKSMNLLFEAKFHDDIAGIDRSFFNNENCTILTDKQYATFCVVEINDHVGLGVAYCSPDDKFDIEIGTLLATCRAFKDAFEEAERMTIEQLNVTDTRPKCYLAGPIDGLSENEYTWWREGLAYDLGNIGIASLDPTRNIPDKVDENGNYDADFIVTMDKKDIQDADFIIAYCPHPSVGTSMEIFYAYEVLKKPVYVVSSQTNLSPWIIKHCTAVFSGFESLLQALKRGRSYTNEHGVQKWGECSV